MNLYGCDDPVFLFKWRYEFDVNKGYGIYVGVLLVGVDPVGA